MTSPHAGAMNMRHIAMNAQWTDFITLLKREVVLASAAPSPCRSPWRRPTAASCWARYRPAPASGSAAICSRTAWGSVPGTGMIGPPAAAAVGITGGNPDAGLEVLKSLTPDQVEAAGAAAHHRGGCEGCARRALRRGAGRSGGHSARVVICTDHTRIVLMEKDGEVLMVQDSAPGCRSSPPRPTSPP